MISAILLINQRGEIVLTRFYRDDVSRAAADAFRLKVIASKETGTMPPVLQLDGCSFLYTRHRNLYFVAVTRGNSNPALGFEFMYHLIKIFQAYFGDEFDEDALKNNMPVIYELMDETMDYGYPQNCAIDILRLYINLGSVKEKTAAENEPGQLTSQITGVVDWRREGLRYKKNEVYIDVLESVNLLMSSNGEILRNDCSGQVMMKTFLTGMPECKFGLNDKLIMDKEPTSQGKGDADKKKSVEIDDCTFHRCVRLGKFDAERTITFIPPDGEFELMRYRVTDNINLPFKIIPAIQETDKSRVSITLKTTANFNNKLFANNFVVKIPTPPNTAKCKVNVGTGRAKFEPDQRAIVWRVKKFTGNTEFTLSAEIELMTTSRAKSWSRPPIAVEFQVPMFTASGVHVRFLRVYDKSGYQTARWVRYLTKAGQYSIRI
jgi:AP-2 complex subunit mu-1